MTDEKVETIQEQTDSLTPTTGADESSVLKETTANEESLEAATEESSVDDKDEKLEEEPVTTPKKNTDPTKGPVITMSGKKRPPFKYDPKKITLRFVFANRDGLAITIECEPSDTVGEVKGALLSVWPDVLPECLSSDRLRLICMGKGVLMPDSRTLEDCQVPVFKTHATPVNVSVKPQAVAVMSEKKKGAREFATSPGGSASNGAAVDQGCACTIL